MLFREERQCLGRLQYTQIQWTAWKYCFPGENHLPNALLCDFLLMNKFDAIWEGGGNGYEGKAYQKKKGSEHNAAECKYT